MGDDRDQRDRPGGPRALAVALTRTVRPDRGGSVGDYLDWQRQAEDMAWFVASADGQDAGTGFAYVGWHSSPGTGNGEAFVLPSHRRSGVGTALYRELADWVQERGCVTLETTVPGGRRRQHRLGRSARVPGGRAQFEARARSHVGRGACDRSARGRGDRHVGRAAGSHPAPSTRWPARHIPTFPGRKTLRWTPTRTGCHATCRARATAPRRRSWRSRAAK